MASISNLEIRVLSSYNEQTQILAICPDSLGGKSIRVYDRSDVTCWQLFLKSLGLGKLARAEVRLANVARYLSQYEWRPVEDPHSDMHSAYLKVCRIANKALLRKGERSLSDKASLTYLNWNENPYKPFPAIQKAMEMALKDSGRYPINQNAVSEFARELAHHHKVSDEQIMLGSSLGSLLHVIADTFSTSGTNVVVPRPTFEYLQMYAGVNGASIVSVDLNRTDYTHDLDEMLRQVNAETKLVYICNPNNPTGTITPRGAIEEFIKKLPPHVYVLIDEAYHDFAEGASNYVSFIDRPIDNDRVIVGRTFSKAYCLAGMRIGYLVGSARTIQLLKRRGIDNTLSIVALKGASAGLKSSSTLKKRIAIIEEQKQEFYRQATSRGLGFTHSFANFVMLETKGHSIQAVISHFAAHNVLIGRPFPLLDRHIRISIGLPSEMEKFWQVWDRLPAIATTAS